MITWMQRHKKWLVITIWISTIAFVGAGFVGWGSYEYGKSSGSVAVVGDREISVEEYQREYSGLYQQYAQVFGEQFNQEMATKMKLHESAINLVIQKNLILSYADDLGLSVTDEDVAKELVKMSAFIKDGKFDKETYIKVLRQNRTTAVDFEESLKRDLLLQKIESLFDLNPSQKEIENLSKLLFAKDKVSIKVLDPNSIKISTSEEKLKEYWETNKIKYMSPNSYEVELSKVALNKVTPTNKELSEHYASFKTDYTKEDGKIKTFEEAKNDMILALSQKATKKEALRAYLSLKKGEDKFDNKVIYFENELPFERDDSQKLISSNVGTVLKPFETKDGFVIVKLLNKIDPKPLAYEDAKVNVKFDYEEIEKIKKLDELAKNELANFKGVDLGYVGRTDVSKVKGLNENEAYGFLNQLFTSSQKQGKIEIGNKVVLYSVTESKLGDIDPANNEAVKQSLLKLQKAELMNSLVKNLETKYEVISSLDVEE